MTGTLSQAYVDSGHGWGADGLLETLERLEKCQAELGLAKLREGFNGEMP